MEEGDIKKSIHRLIEHCRDLTLRLVRLTKWTNQVEGVASGFFFCDGNFTYLVSAGHALRKEGWAIETDLTNEGEHRTACIPVGGAWTFRKFTLGKHELEEVDVGWAQIDLKTFKEDVKGDSGLKGKKFEYIVYQGPLDENPNPKDPHAYAAMNQVTLIDAGGGKAYLERKMSYEFEMEFKGIRPSDGLCVFSVPEHKGHNYYKGASGSPILEPTGKIMAILVQGCREKNELYGYPMKDLLEMIRICKHAEQGVPKGTPLGDDSDA